MISAYPRAAGEIRKGDIVLYRDGARYWAGRPDHTMVCRVRNVYTKGRYELTALTGHQKDRPPFETDQVEYMRLLSAADAMSEFDGSVASVTVEDVIRLRQALPGVHEITTSPSTCLELPSPR